MGSVKRFGHIVLPFAIAETLVWATYFYSFPAFLPIWEQELGFSKASLTGAFTISLVVSAFISPLVGRLIDNGYGGPVFAGSAFLASLMLFLLSGATQIWQFYLIWGVLGIAMSGSLYDACFAIVTNCLGNNARRAITLITLAAGFAGTVSFPSAHFLTAHYGWRTSILLFSITVAFVCVPLILYGSKYANEQKVLQKPRISKRLKDAIFIIKVPTFWFIGASFCLIAINHGLLLSHMLAILTERGLHPVTSVLMASLVGPMQIVGRIIMLIFEKRVTVFAICFGSFNALFVAGWAIYFGSGVNILIVLFIIAQGCGYGILSIIRPTVIAEFLGRRDFGIVSGMLAIGFVLGMAIAPTFGSLLWLYGGYDLVIGTAICIPVLSMAAFIGAWYFQK